MSNTKDPLAAALAAKLAEDPDYLEKILGQAIVIRQQNTAGGKSCLDMIEQANCLTLFWRNFRVLFPLNRRSRATSTNRAESTSSIRDAWKHTETGVSTSISQLYFILNAELAVQARHQRCRSRCAYTNNVR